MDGRKWRGHTRHHNEHAKLQFGLSVSIVRHDSSIRLMVPTSSGCVEPFDVTGHNSTTSIDLLMEKCNNSAALKLDYLHQRNLSVALRMLAQGLDY